MCTHTCNLTYGQTTCLHKKKKQNQQYSLAISPHFSHASTTLFFLQHSPPPWESDLSSLSLGILLCKMGVMMGPVWKFFLWSCCCYCCSAVLDTNMFIYSLRVDFWVVPESLGPNPLSKPSGATRVLGLRCLGFQTGYRVHTAHIPHTMWDRL